LQPPDSASIPADFGLFPSIIVTRLSQEGRHNSNNPKDIRVATYLLATEFLIEGLAPPTSANLRHYSKLNNLRPASTTRQRPVLAREISRTCATLFAAWICKALSRCHSLNALLASVVFSAGLALAVMLNGAVCLLGKPLLLEIAERARIPAVPFLLALATISNIGSAMTLTGNPQNIIIGHASGWGWSA
jgi:hypothetical protein